MQVAVKLYRRTYFLECLRYYYGSSYIPIENDESTTIAIFRLKIKVNNLAL